MALPFPDLGPTIEGYAPSQDSKLCDPTEKRGVVALRSLVMKEVGGADFGIVRDCAIGTPSNHWAGSAWDWRVNAHVPAEAALAERVLDWLFAKDRYGNEHAMFRRLGLSYVIWNGQSWNTFRKAWGPYTGRNKHEDHVHLSWGTEGAMGRTSFYRWQRGELPEGGGLPGPLPVAAAPPLGAPARASLMLGGALVGYYAVRWLWSTIWRW